MAKDDLQPETLGGPNYPTNDSGIVPMSLTNPDNVLSGTQRGTQFVGSPNLQIDNANDLITVKDNVLTSTKIVRLGQISNGFLGLAANDGTNDNLFIGKDSSGTTVIKVAKSGFDVKVATSDQLIFNSSQDIFKIVASGTYTLTVSNPIAKDEIDSGSIAHNLGFTPAHIVYCTIPISISGHTYIAGKLQKLPITFAGGSFIEAIIDANVDSTNINFYAVNVWNGALTWGLTSLTFKYYLLQETAN